MANDIERIRRVNETTKQMTMIQAINDGMRTMLEEDERTIYSEKISVKMEAYSVRQKDFEEKFGDDRVVDTPLSEAGIIGTSIGLAVNGFKPVAEIQFLVLFILHTNK